MSNFTLDHSHELGAGGYGKVVLAKDNTTGEKVAAKMISMSRMKMSAIERENDLMTSLNHEYIIGIRGKEKAGNKMVIYMELAPDGELFSRVITAGVLSEAEACHYFKQLMQAVDFMHKNGVVHRDLKLENVLLSSNNCKVCDFGLAHAYEADPAQPGAFKITQLREVCGSKSYCAPEVLEGRGYYGYPTDVWSCGICLFAMLAGFFPLDEASGADWRFERVKMAAAAKMSVTHTIFGFYERGCTLSKAVTDLIDGMLIIDPAQRLTVEQVLASPWVQSGGAAVVGGPYGAQGAVYRGGGMDFSQEALREMLATESDQAMAPVYRGGGMKGDGPPPLLCKQHAMFCADFHLDE